MNSRTLRLSIAICLAIASTLLALPPVSQAPRPKLVLAVIIDQFRYDYLTRFRSDLHGGLNDLLTHGAVFTNAFYRQVPTVTAVGHSIFLSGAMPAVSGIIGNSWYDRDEHSIVTSVCDYKQKIIGAPTAERKESGCTDADPASPRRLLVTTLGDELRTADPQSKVIGISLKPRAAILPSGHRAAGAYWFDDGTGNFVTSTYYAEQLPSWAQTFNGRKLADTYLDKPWPNFPNWKFRPEGRERPYSRLEASPWGNELVEAFAEAAISGENLGTRGSTDLLTVSFSSNDYVGHRVGPEAPEVRDMTTRTDQSLAKLFRFLDVRLGRGNVLVVLSADHGVASAPSEITKTRLPGGYLTGHAQAAAANALNSRFGNAHWLIDAHSDEMLYVDWNTARDKHIASNELYEAARSALLGDPSLHVARVYDRNQLNVGVGGDFIAQAEENGFNPRRSGDIFLVYEPGYLPGSGSGTTHFSPYNYDTHVPVLFMGPGIRAGRYDEAIAPNDIAPTLATLLNVQTPSGSSGRPLNEILQ